MFPPLLLATRNPGKRLELTGLLSPLPIRLLTTDDFGTLPNVEETGATYAENAGLKAATLALATRCWTLADDTGLEVEALLGAPGLHSARLVPAPRGGSHPTDAQRRRRLLDILAPYPRPWRARFCCVVALASPEGKVDLTEGECSGEVIPTERGTGGFGYDPLFLLEGVGMTMAELSAQEKNRLSHRARAVAALLPILRRRLLLPAGEG